VSSADRFVALLVTILTGVAIISGGITVVLKVLWSIRGSWDTTNAELQRLVDKMEGMDRSDSRLERQIERHLEWHDKH
jgi:hypothetical protein